MAMADAGGVAPLAELARDCDEVGAWMISTASLDDRLAGSVPFLTMCAGAVAGWQLQRQARVSGDKAKLVVAGFFADHVLTEMRGLKAAAMAGAAGLYALDVAELVGG